MSNVVKVRVVLKGHYAGKTVRLGKFQFVDGACTLHGIPTEVASELHFIEVNWQGFPEGHPALEGLLNGQRNISQEAEEGLHDEVQRSGGPEGGQHAQEGTGDSEGHAADETGQARILPDGDGLQAELGGNDKLTRAIQSLDPENDAHWTPGGKPAIEAVAQMYGSTGITRADIENAAKGHTRDSARA